MRNLFLASLMATWLLVAPAWAQPTTMLPPEWSPATAEEERAALQWLKASGKAFDPSAYGEADLAPITAILHSLMAVASCLLWRRYSSRTWAVLQGRSSLSPECSFEACVQR